MKIAILSDIHGNIHALEAVVADAMEKGAGQLLNLGDILYGPIAPRATYDFLMSRDMVTISGNQDRQIYDATPDEIATNPTMRFISDDLGSEPIDWLRHLPFDYQLNDDIYLCHGTPDDDLVYLLEDVSTGHARVRDDSAILELLAGNTSPVILCGHTHIPRSVTLSTGQLVVNPGSVGLPAYDDELPVPHVMENFRPHASYALLEKRGKGWLIGHHSVPYDWELATEKARARGRLDWAHSLSTGRAMETGCGEGRGALGIMVL